MMARASLAAAAFALGALQTWANRYSVWADLMSYIEVGEAYRQGRFEAALGGHWSPLYSWLLAAALGSARPSPEREILVVKLVNLVVYALAIASFDFALRGVVASQRARLAAAASKALPETALVVSAYVAFAWASLVWLVVYRDSPDMLVACLSYVAAGLIVRAPTNTDRDAVALGAVLGIAYLAKTAMLPLAIVFLAVHAIATPGGLRKRRAGLAGLALVLISFPLAAALSMKLGRYTIGESGRLNHAWVVNPAAPDVNWQGSPAGSGTPRHATRKLFSAPDVYEFAQPVGGTYPLWYDPVYWNEGLTPQFSLVQQTTMALRNMGYCMELFGATLLCGFVTLAACGQRFRESVAALVRSPLLWMGVLGTGLFVVATRLKAEQAPWGYLQTRYFGGFVALLFLGALASVRVSPRTARRTGLVAASVSVVLGAILVARIGHEVISRRDAGVNTDWNAARALQNLGLGPGDRVVLVGADMCYWARLAGVKVVAQVDARSFWTASAVRRAEAIASLSGVEPRVLVAPPRARGSRRPVDLEPAGWSRLDATDYYARPLWR